MVICYAVIHCVATCSVIICSGVIRYMVFGHLLLGHLVRGYRGHSNLLRELSHGHLHVDTCYVVVCYMLICCWSLTTWSPVNVVIPWSPHP